MISNNLHKKSGQILIVQALCVFIIVALFLHSVRFAEALKYKQESNLKADLVAVSSARVQAEHLQMLSAINQLMVYEMQIVYVLLIITIVTYGSTSKYLEYLMNSINNLSNLEKKIIKFTPALMYWQTQRIARANGFEGALIYPYWPKLPVKERPIRLYRDALKQIIDNNPLLSDDDGSSSMDDILRGMEKNREKDNSKNKKKKSKNSEEEAPQTKPKPGKRIIKKIKSQKYNASDIMKPDKLKQLMKKILNSLADLMGGPHYLDERYINDQITVYCFDKDLNIRVASARVTHDRIPRNKELVDHDDNNYLNYFKKPNKKNGFQVELVAVPDYLEQIPQIKKALKKITSGIRRLPIELPLKEEHFNWVQH